MKKNFYMELAYVFGIVGLAFGTALIELANLGMSMVVAPAYIIYVKASQFYPFITFGMAEYFIQALLLVIMTIVLRKFKITFLFSFITAIFYGICLDLSMFIVSFTTCEGMLARILFFSVGFLITALAISLLFHTYIYPEVYELFVKELSTKFNWDIHIVKTVFDCTCCVIGIVLSFICFGMWHFVGIKYGTIVCALTNGWLIHQCSTFLEKRFTFVKMPVFSLRNSKKLS